MRRSIRYLLIILFALDLSAALTTITAGIVNHVTAHAVVTVLLAEYAFGVFAWVGLQLTGLFGQSDALDTLPQSVHVITAAPAVTVTRLAEPVHVSNPELVP